MSTTREVAIHIVDEWRTKFNGMEPACWGPNRITLITAIDKALQADRENAAQVAKAFCDQFDKPSVQFKADLMAAIRER